MYKIYNIKEGTYDEFLSIEMAKMFAINMLKLNINQIISPPSFIVVDRIQKEKDELKHASNIEISLSLYFEFFGIDGCCTYVYTVLDIIHDKHIADTYYFPPTTKDGVLQEECLIKIKDSVVLEIYHNPKGTIDGRAVTYDLITKTPIFYYLDNYCTKYDYNTDEVLATSVYGSSSTEIDLDLLLEKYPEINKDNIVANGAREYGHVIEYFNSTPMMVNKNYEQDKLDFIEYIKANKFLTCINETSDENGHIITEVIDTDPWIDEIDFEWD